MRKKNYDELESYRPEGVSGVTCRRFHGKSETGASKFWMGVSEIEPGGGADLECDDHSMEKVYYVLEGKITVTDKNGNQYVVHANESISFPPNEESGLKNEGESVARMLVITDYPDAEDAVER